MSPTDDEERQHGRELQALLPKAKGSRRAQQPRPQSEGREVAEGTLHALANLGHYGLASAVPAVVWFVVRRIRRPLRKRRRS